MRRSFGTLVSIALVAASSVWGLRGARAMTLSPLSGLASVGVLLRVTVAGCGLFACMAVWRQRPNGRRLTMIWAGGTFAVIVLGDVAAGFGRPGLALRVLALLLVAALLVAVVLSVPTSRQGTA